MALESADGTFVSAALASSDTVVDSLGFKPKILIIYTCSRNDGSSGNADHAILTFGVTVEGGTQFAVAYIAENGLSSAPDASNSSKANGVYLTDKDAADDELGTVTLDADGFTINWSAVNAAQPTYCYHAIGGSDIEQCNLDEITVKSSAGSQAYNNTGLFQPDALLLFGCGSLSAAPVAALHAAFFLGVATATASDAIAMGCHAHGGVLTSINRSQDTGYIIRGPRPQGGGSFFKALHTSLDATGFTMDFEQTIANTRMYALTIKGGSWKGMPILSPTTASVASVTGIGFVPNGGIGFGFGRTASTAAIVNNTGNAFGSFSGTGGNAVAIAADEASDPTLTNSQMSLGSFLIGLDDSDPTGALDEDGAVTSTAHDTLSIDWDIAQSAAWQYGVLRHGNAQAGVGSGEQKHLTTTGVG